MTGLVGLELGFLLFLSVEVLPDEASFFFSLASFLSPGFMFITVFKSKVFIEEN